MQNMYVDSLIENIKTKIFIKFHFTKFMIHLAWVANLMVIFSASYQLSQTTHQKKGLSNSAAGLKKPKVFFDFFPINKNRTAKDIAEK